tara:strand:- start:1873 stop:2604 length:732 start_codon:yes stop_codon:yes gene_type:complete
MIADLLIKDGYTSKRICHVGLDETIGDKKLAKFVIFPTLASFKRNLRYIQDKPKHIYFVVASAFSIYQYLPFIVPFDWGVLETKRDISFEARECSYDSLPNLPYEIGQDFIAALTDQVKKGSILNSIMTAIYTISNNQNQKAATLLICKWIMCNLNLSLPELLKAVASECNLSSANIERLEGVLTNPLVATFKKVFKKMDGDFSKTKKLCAKYGIPPFEVNYIVAKCEAVSPGKRNVDELMNG